jgi:hypothetical protein
LEWEVLKKAQQLPTPACWYSGLPYLVLKLERGERSRILKTNLSRWQIYSIVAC